MKLLITGGAGFIGSEFVRLTAGEGLDIIVVDKLTYAADKQRIASVKDKIRFYQADISDKAALEGIFKTENPEAIVHFAAETHVDRSIVSPQDFIVSNILGTETLLELSLKYKTEKFIHISTDEVYGELPADKTAIFMETDPLLPNSPYSASKAGADMLVRAFSKTYGLATVVVRPSNNYGPWQYPEKLLPLMIAKLLLGEKVPVYGKGENIRTWLFVEDCAQAILRLLYEGKSGEIYNVGSNEERRNIDVVRKVIQRLGKDDGAVEFVADRPGHDFRYAVDTAKIQSHTGWRPLVTFDEGIERTVSWYVENKEWLLKKKAEVEGFVAMLKKEYKGRIRDG